LLSATQIDAVARRAVRLVESFPSRENPGIGKRALLLWEVRPAALALTAASPLRHAAASAPGQPAELLVEGLAAFARSSQPARQASRWLKQCGYAFSVADITRNLQIQHTRKTATAGRHRLKPGISRELDLSFAFSQRMDLVDSESRPRLLRPIRPADDDALNGCRISKSELKPQIAL